MPRDISKLANSIHTELRSNIITVGRYHKLSLSDIAKIISHIHIKYTDDEILNAILPSRHHIGEMQQPCLEWTGRFVKSNKYENVKYAILSLHGHDCLVHRSLFHNFKKEVPLYEKTNKNVLICRHHLYKDCHCISPSHICLGTPRQNFEDAVRMGTVHSTYSYQGSANPNSKLSWDDVHAIRRMRPHISYKNIAASFGVSIASIVKICSYQSWRGGGNTNKKRPRSNRIYSKRSIPRGSTETMLIWANKHLKRKKVTAIS